MSSITWSKKQRCLRVTGVLCGILAAALVIALAAIVLTAASRKHRTPRLADFDLVDAILKQHESGENDKTSKYNLTVAIAAANANKDTFWIRLGEADGVAVFGNRTFARARMSPAAVGPGEAAALTAVFMGTIPVTPRCDIVEQFRVFNFVVNIEVEEFIARQYKNDEIIVNRGKYKITCDVDIGLCTDPELTSSFHHSSWCDYL